MSRGRGGQAGRDALNAAVGLVACVIGALAAPRPADASLPLPPDAGAPEADAGTPPTDGRAPDAGTPPTGGRAPDAGGPGAAVPGRIGVPGRDAGGDTNEGASAAAPAAAPTVTAPTVTAPTVTAPATAAPAVAAPTAAPAVAAPAAAPAVAAPPQSVDREQPRLTGPNRPRESVPPPVHVRPPAAPPTKPPAWGTQGDPGLDHGFLAPTAMTLPAGSVSVGVWELLVIGATLGLADGVQLTILTLPPFFVARQGVLAGDVKVRLPLGSRIHVAAMVGGGASGSFSVSGAGAAVSGCLDRQCSSLLSVSAARMSDSASVFDPFHLDTYHGHLDGYSASAIVRVTENLKVVAELIEGRSRASGGEDEHGYLLDWGIRVYQDTIAVNLGFLRASKADGLAGTLGVPFFALTGRVR